ncbi:class I SAM-dependent methyltransferase [Candidatus Thorarchaeota archaeon]|nr:MAG: class I SAM-dependent methyltransferase [Candidatus Thorarchaeota archaeon]
MNPNGDTPPDPDEHGRIVRQGYDEIADVYNEQRGIFDNQREINDFISCLPEGGEVLDIGCGGGVPVLKTLTKRGFSATGIDFSKAMLRIAERNVPEADLINGDITKTRFPDESFDGVISTYAIIHIHRSLHAALYAAIHRWLKPQGVLLVSTATDEVGSDYSSEDYLGTKMAWSHPGGQESVQLIKDVGFKIVFARTVTTGEETHLWILARKGWTAKI